MKSSIIIPFRDRHEHLNIFIKNTLEAFVKYFNQLEILIIEQADNKKFNRGKLLNIGFLESSDIDFVITHDVDIIPSEKLIKEFYTINSYDALRIFTAHEKSLGGICKLSSCSFQEANGFPNNIWGWGIEDRALFYRYTINKNNMSDYLKKTTLNMLKNLPHKPNNEIYSGEKKKISDLEDLIFNTENKEIQLSHFKKSGLNNINYEIISSQKLNKHTKLISVKL
jgi:hypothetical protein